MGRNLKDRYVTAAIAIGAVFHLGTGVWAFAAPRSFYEVIATFPPYNVHFLHDVVGQHALQPVEVTVGTGGEQTLHDARLLLPVGVEPLRVLGDPLPRPAVELTGVGLVDAKDLGDLAVRMPERLAQDEHRPLRRGQPLQQDQNPE